MGLELPYTSSIKDMPFLFSDMRRTAQLCAAFNCDRWFENEMYIHTCLRQSIFGCVDWKQCGTLCRYGYLT
ncbi:MAG: hypothetical protein A4E55_02405 [Pelotomaculum sp. PtaU1.Bin035]|nr:MAG: hypothetical protein A4E55_02405 [Pelotomaculum sp. PtaU1.Bin035]